MTESKNEIKKKNKTINELKIEAEKRDTKLRNENDDLRR